jgi:hypothetical protein
MGGECRQPFKKCRQEMKEEKNSRIWSCSLLVKETSGLLTALDLGGLAFHDICGRYQLFTYA